MRDQVLDIFQCKELLALGLDMSDASCIWSAITDSEGNVKSWLPIFRGEKEDWVSIELMRKEFPVTYKKGNLYYTYTLSDMLKKLYPIRNNYHFDGDDYIKQVFDILKFEISIGRLK